LREGLEKRVDAMVERGCAPKWHVGETSEERAGRLYEERWSESEDEPEVEAPRIFGVVLPLVVMVVALLVFLESLVSRASK
jgi:hypothetical protein